MDDPVWLDKKGNEVTKDLAFGRQCTHRLIRPDMCIVADETGGNISQKGDGHIGGRKLICVKAQFLMNKYQQKTSTLL